jgi:hypothetical protein
MIIFGVVENGISSDKDAVIDILNKGLHLDGSKHVEEVARIGRITKDKIRPIRVKVDNTDSKREILRRAKALRESGLYNQIFIAPDLTKKQQVIDKLLRDQCKQLREDYKEELNQGANIVIKNGKVIKNGLGKQETILYDPKKEENQA